MRALVIALILAAVSLSLSGACSFDDRIGALRCEGADTDWGAVEASLSAQVSSVVVSFCSVPSLPPSAFGNRSLSLLRRLTVSHSGLATVAPGAFEGVADALEYLDLSRNKLTLIPLAVLDLAALISLDLSGNLIKTLPHGSAFNNLNVLIRLDLSRNL